MNCYKVTENVKKLLTKLEPSNLNEPSDEIENTEVPTMKTFDLWAYHTSKATTQIEDRTAPIHQQVFIGY